MKKIVAYVLIFFLGLIIIFTLFVKNNYKQNVVYNNKKVNEKLPTIVGSFSSSLDYLDTYYLALNGTKKIDFTFDYPDSFDKTVTWTVDNSEIVKIDNNTIYGLKTGNTNIKATLKDGKYKIYNITVTDLITPMIINNDKPYLPCENYTADEAILLDKILFSRVKEAGEGTRGGVIAAARFITLEFKYKIRYFNENGRLVDHGVHNHIDGEGRYYHKGLYLSTSKYQELEQGASSSTGPKIWGCELYDSFIGKYNMNGFTCSGFVTWAMLNGGFDVGDVGAGDYQEFNDDLSDLGVHQEITIDYMQNGGYKVGDFIARDEHAALIIGIDDENIYTAESLPPMLKVYTYERYNGIVNDPNLTYVIEMSNIYSNGEGSYQKMW